MSPDLHHPIVGRSLLWTALLLPLLAIPSRAQEPAGADACGEDKGFALTGDPTSDEIDAYAGVYLQQGQILEALCLIREHYRGRPRSVPSYALEGLAELLRVQLRQDAAAQGFESPRELLERQNESLQKGLDAVGNGVERLEALRREELLDVDRYKTLLMRLLIVEARLRMALGDESYRLRGARLTAQAEGSSGGAATALVEYGRARERLYLCLLLDARPEALQLAKQVDQRIRWIREGRFFGGLRFFELDPFVDSSNQRDDWNVRVALHKLLDGPTGLEQAYNKRLEVLKEGDETLKQLRLRLRDEQQRLADRNERRAAYLHDRLADLLRSSAKLKDEEERVKVQRLHQAMLEFQNTESLRTDLERHLQTLEDRRQREILDLTTSLSTLKLLAGRKEISGLPGVSDSQAQGLKDGLEALAPESTGLAAGLTNWPDKSTAAHSLTALRQEIDERRAAVESATALIDQARLDLEIQIRQIDQARLEKEIGDLQGEMDRRKEEFRRFAQATGDEMQALKEKIAANTIEHIKARKEELEGRIRHVQEEIGKVQEFFAKVRKGTEDVRRAIQAAQAVIAQAGSLPTAITSLGTFNDYPASLMELEKTGLKLVELAAQAEITYEGIRTRIRQVKGEVETYRRQLDQVRLDQLEGELRQELQKEHDLLRREQARIDEFVAMKTAEAKAKVREISGIAYQVAGSERRKVEAKIRQYEADVKQAKAALERAVGEHRGTEYQAADQVFLLLARLEEIEHLGGKVRQVKSDRDALLQEPPTSPKIEPSPTLRLVLDEIEQIRESIRKYQENPESVDVASVLELTAPRHGASLLDLDDEYQSKLEETNRSIFGFANWLYFMTGDPGVLDWAIWCRTVPEAKKARDELERHYGTLMREMAGAQPRNFAVRLRAEDLERRALAFARRPALGGRQRDGRDEIWFRVSSIFPDIPIRQGEDFTFVEGLKSHFVDRDRGLRTYFPAGRSRAPSSDPGLEELVFWPKELADNPHPAFLFDAYVIAEWKGDDGFDHPVALEPVGPTAYRDGDGLRETPWYSPGRPIHENRAASWSDFDDRQDMLYGERINNSYKIFSSPFVAHNYPTYMGRGIDNTWKLVFPENWGVEQLESLTVVFTYVSPTSVFGVAALGAGAENLPQAPAPTEQGADGLAGNGVGGEADRGGPDAALQRLVQAYRQERRWYDSRGADFERSPVASGYRLEQVRQALEMLPDTETLLAADAAQAGHGSEAGELRELLIPVPEPTPGIGLADLDSSIEQVVRGQLLKSYAGTETPSLVNQIPLDWFRKKVFEILDRFLRDLTDRFLPDLETARKTLETSRGLLEKPGRLAARIDWEFDRMEAQERWLGSLQRLFEEIRTPRVSKNDERWLRQAAEWARDHGDAVAIAHDQMARDPEIVDYLLELLLTAQRDSLEWLNPPLGEAAPNESHEVLRGES